MEEISKKIRELEKKKDELKLEMDKMINDYAEKHKEKTKT